MPIGDLATAFFADHNVFAAGRVDQDDMNRVMLATGGLILSTVSDIKPEYLGHCGLFEEK